MVRPFGGNTEEDLVMLTWKDRKTETVEEWCYKKIHEGERR